MKRSNKEIRLNFDDYPRLAIEKTKEKKEINEINNLRSTSISY